MSSGHRQRYRVKLLVIGKTAFPWISEGLEVYEKRINRYTTFKTEVVPDVKNAGSLPQSRLMDLEAEAFLKCLGDRDEVILLDDKGKQYNSENFSKFLEARLGASDRPLVFIVGGAFGFGQKLRERADSMLSLSAMTFSHQIIRVIFAEQLYRAFTIIKGEPYHHQ